MRSYKTRISKNIYIAMAVSCRTTYTLQKLLGNSKDKIENFDKSGTQALLFMYPEFSIPLLAALWIYREVS